MCGDSGEQLSPQKILFAQRMGGGVNYILAKVWTNSNCTTNLVGCQIIAIVFINCLISNLVSSKNEFSDQHWRTIVNEYCQKFYKSKFPEL